MKSNVGTPYIQKTYNFTTGRYVFEVFQEVKNGKKTEKTLLKTFDDPHDASMDAYKWLRNNTKTWASRW